MSPAALWSRLRQTLPVAVAGGLLLSYVLLWISISPVATGRSDFTSTYVGALLLRRGLGSALYSLSAQTPVYLAAIAPLHAPTLPFVDAPTAAAIALPLTFLSLPAAYRIWSALQVLLILAAVVIAVRSAPRGTAGPARQVTIVLIAASGAGTAATLILGQWDGVWALGVAVLYACFRQGRMAAAGAVLAVTALVAKPQLGLGLAAFLLAWGERRLLLGAVGAGVGMLLLWLAVAGPAGLLGFAGAIVHSVGEWQPSMMISFLGVAGNLVGNTAAAHLVGAAGSVACMAVAAVLGRLVRRGPHRLEAGLAAAAILSLVAAPHAFAQDLPLLAPPVAWSLCALDAAGRRAAPAGWAVVALWMGISVAVGLDVATQAARPLGVLTPWLLLIAAALATGACVRQAGSPRPGPATPAESSAPLPTGRAAAHA
jgi:hypothetical protein